MIQTPLYSTKYTFYRCSRLLICSKDDLNEYLEQLQIIKDNPDQESREKAYQAIIYTWMQRLKCRQKVRLSMLFRHRHTLEILTLGSGSILQASRHGSKSRNKTDSLRWVTRKLRGSPSTGHYMRRFSAFLTCGHLG